MDARTLTRLGSCLLVAALATGCGPLRGSRPDSTTPPIPLPPATGGAAPAGTSAANETIPGGTVIAAGGAGTTRSAAPTPVGPAVPPTTPAPLAPPRLIHSPPVWSTAGDPQTPAMVPPVPPAPGGPRPADPHVRNTPTAAGGRLALGPGEVPTDRIVELTLHLEGLLAQNRELLARVKELEAAGVGREQALAEAAREVDSITAEAAKTRAALQAQIIILQSKIKQLEEEDITFLKGIIGALERLYPPEKKP